MKNGRFLVAGGGALAAGALALALVSLAGCSGARADADSERKMIVLGIDGMDWELTRRLIAEGRLPHLAELAERGVSQPLGTSVPPLSPVAWSNFITGQDSGVHGIFDFIHRRPETMIPYLSTSQPSDGGRTLTLGSWQIPLSGGGYELLRHGTPFWEPLEEAGVETTLIRMPANFPPSGTATVELSGMGTPDILGHYGTFSFYTSELFFEKRDVAGGELFELDYWDDVARGQLHGPPNPFRVDGRELTTPFELYVDADEPVAKLVVGDEERILEAGEWSDWVPVEFDLVPTQTLHGIARFYLRSVRPEVELYVSPINWDPLFGELPMSTPEGFATELAEATGRFYTQGMPEDTQALKGEVLTEAEFLAQARIAGEENERQFRWVLERWRSGLLFYYFGNLDQVSHMMWGAMDPEHPGYVEERDAPNRDVVIGLYERADRMVGEAMAAMDDGTTLIVMSDHGFTSWRRSFHLNAWLWQNGYLAVKNPDLKDDPGMFLNVDWSKTRAYGLGLNGLYVNLKGREKHGIVDPGERHRLIEEIAAGLLAAVDPATGRPAITKVYPREKAFAAGEMQPVGPDLVVGYAKGTRGESGSALGEVARQVFTDNIDDWSGDHGMDHETVPGILFASRPLGRPVADLKDLARAIVAEFGVDWTPGTAGP